jgi:hypothetical protein
VAYLSLLATLPLLIVAFYRLQIARHIEDLPTSSIVAAAQGLVEIKAKTIQFDDKPLLVPRLGISCVWYRYETVDYNQQERVIDARESINRFYVADETGACAVDPFHAEVHPKKSKQEQDGSTLYKMSWIGIDEQIYILGWLHTLHPRPKTDDVLRDYTKTKIDADTVVKRYGHLKKKLDRITRSPYPGMPFVITTHYEHTLVSKMKRQAKYWFGSFFAALVVLFFIIENWKSLF